MEEKKVQFDDLSKGLKIVAIFGYVMLVIFAITFFVGFIDAIMEGI